MGLGLQAICLLRDLWGVCKGRVQKSFGQDDLNVRHWAKIADLIRKCDCLDCQAESVSTDIAIPVGEAHQALAVAVRCMCSSPRKLSASA